MENGIAQLRHLLRKDDRVLLCLPRNEMGPWVDAIEGSLAIPVCCSTAPSWKELLQLSFLRQVRIIIAPAPVLLGLAKLSRFTKTPLYVRHALVVGEPCPSWMVETIDSSLDCHIYGLEPEQPGQDDMDPLCCLPAWVGSWTSILDCSIAKGENGLEIEIIAFRGEMLPKLPSCARLIVRNWEPEVDIPFCVRDSWIS